MSFEAIPLNDPRVTRLEVLGPLDIVHIKRPSTGRDHWMFAQDLFRAIEGRYPTWRPEDAPYATGAKVTWNFRLWESLHDDNEAVPSEGAWWTEVSGDEEDISDPVTLDLITIDTSGAGPYSIDMGNAKQRMFKCSDDIVAARTWQFANDDSGLLIPSLIIPIGLAGVGTLQTFPNTVIGGIYNMGAWDQDNFQWTPDQEADYEFSLSSDGDNWRMKLIGVYP